MSQDTDVAAREVLAGLRAALDPDAERAARKFVLLRRKLVSFFEWGGATSPEACADETLSTMAWTLTDGPIQNVPACCAATARTILNKQKQPRIAPPAAPIEAPAAPVEAPAASVEATAAPIEPSATSAAVSPALESSTAPAEASTAPAVASTAPAEPPATPADAPEPEPPDPFGDHDWLLHAFEKQLDELPDDSRELVLTYYAGEKAQALEARHALARRLQLPLNQMRLRAHRTRSQVEQSVLGLASSSSGEGR